MQTDKTLFTSSVYLRKYIRKPNKHTSYYRVLIPKLSISKGHIPTLEEAVAFRDQKLVEQYGADWVLYVTAPLIHAPLHYILSNDSLPANIKQVSKNFSSGVIGVSGVEKNLKKNGLLSEYWIASWSAKGKKFFKYFNCAKYKSAEEAFLQAVLARAEKVGEIWITNPDVLFVSKKRLTNFLRKHGFPAPQISTKLPEVNKTASLDVLQQSLY